MRSSPTDLAADVRKRHLYLERGHWYVIGHGELEEFEELVALAERVEVADERHRIDLAAVKGQRERAEAAEAALADMRRALEDAFFVFADTQWAAAYGHLRALAAAGPAPGETVESRLAHLEEGLREIGREAVSARPDVDHIAKMARALLAAAGPAPEHPDPSSHGGHPYTPAERAMGYGTPDDPRFRAAGPAPEEGE